MEYIGIIKKTDSIADVLRAEILSGRIPGGTELNQVELAESLGVSRMPVREALIILQYQGLMERLANNHMKVINIDEKYFNQIFKICADLESDFLPEFIPEGLTVPLTAPEEKLFHRQAYLTSPVGFSRTMMRTIIEVYVNYALQYSSEDARKILADAIMSSGDTKTILYQYFDVLLQNMMKER